MIGASKINNNTNDLQRLQEMFDMGLNNTQISKIFRTNSGESLSRIHISQIRRNKRWNTENHSFVMKDEVKDFNSIKTELDDDIYHTVVGLGITHSPMNKTTVKSYFILHYKNSNLMNEDSIVMLENKPTDEELLRNHNKFIFDDISESWKILRW